VCQIGKLHGSKGIEGQAAENEVGVGQIKKLGL